MKILDEFVPVKCKYLRANDGPYMTKDLRKAIMLRSKLKNKLFKEKTATCRVAYKKQRNKCTSLVRKAKKDYYSNLKPNSVTDNKTFWKNVKPLFSDKKISCENI